MLSHHVIISLLSGGILSQMYDKWTFALYTDFFQSCWPEETVCNGTPVMMLKPPPTHSHPYFSALSAFPSTCFNVQIFSLLIYSFKFHLRKHKYLKSSCLIINSACHNYICIKVLYIYKNGKTIYSKWKYLSPTMTLKMESRSYKYNQH